MSCGFVSADDEMAGRVGGVEILRLIGKQKPEFYHAEEITPKGRTWRGVDKMWECLGCERTKAGGLRDVGVPRMDLHVRV